MQFELTNGKGLIEIGLGRGSYLKFNKPLSVVWGDGYGSIAQFLTISKKEDSYRKIVNSYINDTLYNDFTDRLVDAYNFLKPLIELFDNGKYGLSFSNSDNKDFFAYESSRDNFSKKHYADWTLHIPNETDSNNPMAQQFRHKKFLFENSITKKYYPSNLLDYSTYNFYDADGGDLVATQPKESIDLNRVKFYKEEISKGKRPFAIVISKFISTEEKNSDGTTSISQYDSANFVLDGHHKLLAYQELKIYPPILSITSFPDKMEDLKFDMNEVKNVIFSWQYEHLCKD
jgi:hypothetical protein